MESKSAPSALKGIGMDLVLPLLVWAGMIIIFLNIKHIPYDFSEKDAAALFGLSHAILTVPPTWPWAVWTAILGLTLGYIREKDGSILAAAILHGMVDFPLVFMS